MSSDGYVANVIFHTFSHSGDESSQFKYSTIEQTISFSYGSLTDEEVSAVISAEGAITGKFGQ